MTLANVCGSDLHYWRGDLDYVKMGRPLPLNTGHEHLGRVARLGPGVTTDSAGQPLAVGDRVVYRFFFPCGRCRACLMRRTKSCPVRQANWLVSCEVWPHFYGAFGDYYYLRPNHAVFKVPDELSDPMVAGVNCAFTQVVAGLQLAGLRMGEYVVIQGAGGLGVYATAVAREMGAGRVIVIDSVRERLELARSSAPTSRRHARAPDAEQRVKRVRALTDDWGADVVMELVGHPACRRGAAHDGARGRYLEIGNINVGWTAARSVAGSSSATARSWAWSTTRPSTCSGAGPDAPHAHGTRGTEWSATRSHSSRSTRPSSRRTRAASRARRSSRTDGDRSPPCPSASSPLPRHPAGEELRRGTSPSSRSTVGPEWARGAWREVYTGTRELGGGPSVLRLFEDCHHGAISYQPARGRG